MFHYGINMELILKNTSVIAIINSHQIYLTFKYFGFKCKVIQYSTQQVLRFGYGVMHFPFLLKLNIPPGWIWGGIFPQGGVLMCVNESDFMACNVFVLEHSTVI